MTGECPIPPLIHTAPVEVRTGAGSSSPPLGRLFELRGYRHYPQIPAGITWAKTSKETPYGKQAVNWKISDSYLQTSLEIPVGIRAHYILPEGIESYTLNGKLYKGREVSIQSGRHHLSISL